MKHQTRPRAALPRRAVVSAIGWVAPALFFTPAFAIPEITPGGISLAGQFLIATPAMGDPRFARTVMLLVRPGKSGATGITINRPIERVSLADLVRAIGGDASGADTKIRVFVGGPVSPEGCLVLHDAAYRRAGTIDIDGRVAMTSGPEILRDIGGHAGPRQYLVALGYAGWGPGQLESELARRDWVTAPDDPALVFDADRARVWDLAVTRARRGP